MNTYFGFAYAGEGSPGKDAYADGDHLANRCHKQLEEFGERKRFPPKLLVLLASPKYLEHDRARDLVLSIATFFNAEYGERVPLIGSSVDAVFYDQKIHESGALLICLASELLQAKVGAVTGGLAEGPSEEAIKSLITTLGIKHENPNPYGNRKLLLFLPRRSSGSHDILYKHVWEAVDYQLPITGGVSHPVFSSQDPGLQFTEFGVQRGALVAAKLDFDIPVASGLGRSLQRSGKHARVEAGNEKPQVRIEEDGTTIDELVEKKEFALLGHTVEDRSMATVIFRKEKESGRVYHEGTLKKGDRLELLEAKPDQIYEQAKFSVTEPRRRAQMNNPVGAITFLCSGCYQHRDAVGLDVKRQLEKMKDGLEGAPVVGGFFYGEIGVDFSGRSMLANWAGATLTFGDEMQERYMRQRGFEAIASASGPLNSAESMEEVIEASLNMVEQAGYPGSMLSLVLPDGLQDSRRFIPAPDFRGQTFSKLKEMKAGDCLTPWTDKLDAIARKGKPDYLLAEEGWPRQYVIPLYGVANLEDSSGAKGSELLGFLHVDPGAGGKKPEPQGGERQVVLDVLGALGTAVGSSLARILVWEEASIMRQLDHGMAKALVADSVHAGRKILIETAVKAFGGNSGYIRIQKGNKLKIVAGTGSYYDIVREFRAEIEVTDQSLSAQAFVLEESRAINNPVEDALYKNFRIRYSGQNEQEKKMSEALESVGSYAVAVLIDVSNKKMGTVIIQAAKAWRFHKYHLRCLKTFDVRLRSVVDRLQAITEARFLWQIGNELPPAYPSNIDNALKRVVQNFKDAWSAHIVSLFLWEPSFERFVLYAQLGWRQDGWEQAAYYSKHEGWTGSVALEDKPHHVEDLQTYKEGTGSPPLGIYESAMFGSFDELIKTDDKVKNTEALGLPIKLGGKPLGVLVAFRRHSHKGDDEREPLDIDVLAQGAEIIAGYVSALLLQRTRQLDRDRARRRAAICNAMQAAGERGGEQAVCREFSIKYDADRVFFYTLSHDSRLECKAGYIKGKESPDAKTPPDEDVERVKADHQPRFKKIEPKDGPERRDPGLAARHGLLYRACIPLSFRGSLLGIIDIHWPEDMKRSAQILRDGCDELDTVASVLASDYQNYRQKAELTTETTKAGGLEAKMRRTTDAMLAPAKQALHRCQNLDALLEGLEHLVKLGKDQEKLLGRISEIRLKTRQLPRAMRFLKTGVEPSPAEESLNSLVEKAALELAWDERAKPINNVPAGLMVNVNREWVVEAFINIIDNGIRAIHDKGEPGILTISATELGENVRIVFKDTGIGMTKAEVTMLEKGIDQAAKPDRTGVGVPLARVLLVEHGGELKIDSEKGFGTEVVVTLPSARRRN